MKRIQIWMIVFAITLASLSVSKPASATTVFGNGDRIEICFADTIGSRASKTYTSIKKPNALPMVLTAGMVAVGSLASPFAAIPFAAIAFQNVKQYFSERKIYKEKIKTVEKALVVDLNRILNPEFLREVGSAISTKIRGKKGIIKEMTFSGHEGKTIVFKRKSSGIYVSKDFILNPNPDCSAPIWRRSPDRKGKDLTPEQKKKKWDDNLS